MNITRYARRTRRSARSLFRQADKNRHIDELRAAAMETEATALQLHHLADEHRAVRRSLNAIAPGNAALRDELTLSQQSIENRAHALIAA